LGTAYTPGLKVSAQTTIEKMRRLPLKGQVVVREGDRVAPNTVVARTELPGIMQIIKLADRMGLEPKDALQALQIQEGQTVRAGDLIAVTPGLWGRFFKSEFKSPFTGTVELISPTTGNVGIREAPTPVEKEAYVIEGEGAVVTTEGALVQGIFGVGGERLGTIAVAVGSADEPLTEEKITSAHRDKIVIGGSNVTGGALRKAAQSGVLGIVVGGVVDRELMDYLAEALNEPGFDIGVAITGQEAIPFTLILTEGFGTIAMATRTFALLQSLEGRTASINGATQIRAGVIRPEVIVPNDENAVVTPSGEGSGGLLELGTPIRVIREPYFGLLGRVTDLPHESVQVESETWVRVLEAQLADGRVVRVPRANVEIIETV
jgi:hypothetical protein